MDGRQTGAAKKTDSMLKDSSVYVKVKGRVQGQGKDHEQGPEVQWRNNVYGQHISTFTGDASGGVVATHLLPALIAIRMSSRSASGDSALWNAIKRKQSSIVHFHT